mgnify:FL=1
MAKNKRLTLEGIQITVVTKKGETNEENSFYDLNCHDSNCRVFNAPTTAAQSAKLISKEFTPSDPKNVKLNAGKPQLVEFFAFW